MRVVAGQGQRWLRVPEDNLLEHLLTHLLFNQLALSAHAGSRLFGNRIPRSFPPPNSLERPYVLGGDDNSVEVLHTEHLTTTLPISRCYARVQHEGKMESMEWVVRTHGVPYLRVARRLRGCGGFSVWPLTSVRTEPPSLHAVC